MLIINLFQANWIDKYVRRVTAKDEIIEKHKSIDFIAVTKIDPSKEDISYTFMEYKQYIFNCIKDNKMSSMVSCIRWHIYISILNVLEISKYK
jgi:hypothetical protein